MIHDSLRPRLVNATSMPPRSLVEQMNPGPSRAARLAKAWAAGPLRDAAFCALGGALVALGYVLGAAAVSA